MRQQKTLLERGQRTTPMLWTLRPKIHQLDHQFQVTLHTRVNSRHTHCFVDEDSMKWSKLLCKRYPAKNLELFLMKASRLRMGLSATHKGAMARMRHTSALRSK